MEKQENFEEFEQKVNILMKEVQECNPEDGNSADKIRECAEFLQEIFNERNAAKSVADILIFLRKMSITNPLNRILFEKVNEIEKQLDTTENDKDPDILSIEI